MKKPRPKYQKKIRPAQRPPPQLYREFPEAAAAFEGIEDGRVRRDQAERLLKMDDEGRVDLENLPPGTPQNHEKLFSALVGITPELQPAKKTGPKKDDLEWMLLPVIRHWYESGGKGTFEKSIKAVHGSKRTTSYRKFERARSTHYHLWEDMQNDPEKYLSR